MQQRDRMLTAFGASAEATDEILRYNTGAYDHSGFADLAFPLADEPFVSAWESYAEESRAKGVFATLKGRLVQLSFPVEKGISSTAAYRSATLKGARVGLIAEATGLSMIAEHDMALEFRGCPAGSLPILTVRNRADFAAVIRALAFKNEPVEVPESMGALVVAGYNNWDRLGAYRKEWEGANPDSDWSGEFKRIIPRTDLYRDKFIIVCDSPYSGVAAGDLGLDEKEWSKLSREIRIGHELCHYFCKRVLKNMRSNAFDELIADYCGIVAATGRFHVDWLLAFLGLEKLPRYRCGGRLENYRLDLSDEAFEVLCRLVAAAAVNVQRLDLAVEAEQDKPYKVITALSRFALEELAQGDALERLLAAYVGVQSDWRICR